MAVRSKAAAAMMRSSPAAGRRGSRSTLRRRQTKYASDNANRTRTVFHHSKSVSRTAFGHRESQTHEGFSECSARAANRFVRQGCETRIYPSYTRPRLWEFNQWRCQIQSNWLLKLSRLMSRTTLCLKATCPILFWRFIHLLQGWEASPNRQCLELRRIPAVPIRRSVTPDYLICLEDGKRFKSLRRHLRLHSLTPEEYREKWKLPSDYPMVAPNYAAQRSALATKIGLGQKRRKAR